MSSTEPLSDQQRDVLLAVVALRDADPTGADVYNLVADRRDSINRSYVYQVLRDFDDCDLIDTLDDDDDSRSHIYQPTVWGIEVVKEYRTQIEMALDGREPVDEPDLPDHATADGDYAPTSAPWVRAARAQGVAQDIRDFLGTESSEPPITMDQAVKLTGTTESLVRKAINARSEWFNLDDDDTIRLTAKGQAAADESPFNDLDIIQ